MCVHDAEHDFKYSVFKVVVHVKYEFKFSLVLIFLTVSGWLVSFRCIWLVVSWSVVGWSVGKWSMVCGWSVGGFKESLSFLS